MTKPKAKTKNEVLTDRTVAAAAAPIEPVKSGHAGAKVTVACKLAMGIVMQLYEMRDTMENVSGGNSRVVKIAHPVGKAVTVRGNSTAFGIQKPLIGGYALTPNVDKDFFDQWLRQNKDADYVKNGMVFAHGSRDHIEGMAEDRKDVKSGLEPLDMTMIQKGTRQIAKDARIPRTRNRNLTDIAPDTEKDSEAA